MNKGNLREMLRYQALGYHPSEVTQDVIEQIKREDIISKVRNPTYSLAFSYGLKSLFFGVALVAIGTLPGVQMLQVFANYFFGAALFFFIGWIVLRSVR